MADCLITLDTSQQKKASKAYKADLVASAGDVVVVDPVVLAFYYLMEAANISAHSANISSKDLNQNAVAQEALDNQAKQFRWNYVPKLISDKHTINGNPFTTYPNQDLVDNAQAKNQEVVAQRGIIANKLNVLQQRAKIGEAKINQSTDDSMESMQEEQGVMQILQNLTFQALMRQPPQ